MLHPNIGLFGFFICNLGSSHRNVNYSLATDKETKEHVPWCGTHKQNQVNYFSKKMSGMEQ